MVWRATLQRLEGLKARALDFETIDAVTHAIAEAGAPVWAKRLREEKVAADDPLLPTAWRDAWDHAAAEALLSRIDERQKLGKLAVDRLNAERQCRKFFGELVRERTFYELDRRLSPSIKSALVGLPRPDQDWQRDGEDRLDSSTRGARGHVALL